MELVSSNYLESICNHDSLLTVNTTMHSNILTINKKGLKSLKNEGLSRNSEKLSAKAEDVGEAYIVMLCL